MIRNEPLIYTLGQMLNDTSGCTTFLKTIAGETHGFYLDSESDIEYQGLQSFTCGYAVPNLAKVSPMI